MACEIRCNGMAYTLLIVAATLGGVATLLGVLYAYIYCTKIRSRRRGSRGVEHRQNYFSRASCSAKVAVHMDNDAQERNNINKSRIKAHPFFVISYLSKFRAEENATCSGGVSTGISPGTVRA